MLSDRSGMALLLTLLAVSFMAAVTVQLASSVNWQMQAAASQGRIVQLDAMLLSGLRLAQAALLLDQQANRHDSSWDSWGTFDAEALSALFPEGSMEIKVEDLSGRLQINALVLNKEEKKKQDQQNKKLEGRQKKDKEGTQRALWLRLLRRTAGVEEDEQSLALMDALADWLDADGIERERGAEQEHYGSLSPPYSPADGPMLLNEELLLVKGWERKILHGVGDEEKAGKAAGIMEFLTSAGRDGRININAAPAPVLQALDDDMTEDLAALLIDFRQQEGNKDALEQPDWYRQVPGFPGDVVLDPELLSTKGSFFKVTVSAEAGGLRRSGEGVLRRRSSQQQLLLYWKVQ